MSRTTLGSLAIGLTLTTGLASAGTHSSAIGALAAQSAVSQAADSTDSRQEAVDLLTRARQAMDEGSFEAAASLIERAEALDANFGMFHLGDTPKKARRDLERLREQAGSSGPAAQDPFAAQAAQQPQAGAAMQPAAGSSVELAAAPQQSPMPQQANNAPDQRAASDRCLVGARKALSAGDLRAARELVGQARQMQVQYDFYEDSPTKVETLIDRATELQQRADGGTPQHKRAWAELQMQQAEDLMRWQEWNDAERLVMEVQRSGMEFGPFETNPQSMLARIAEGRNGGPAAAPGGGDLAIRRLPTTADNEPAGAQPMGQQPVASQAQPLSPADAKGRALQLVQSARAALANGDFDQAESLAFEAEQLGVEDSQFGPQDDRPWLVLLEVQKRRRSAGSVMPAAGQTAQQPAYPGAQAFYDPQNDPTRNVPAAAQVGELPPPQGMQAGAAPAESEAMQLLQMGEQALRQGDVDAAQALFVQAQARQHELDPATRQRLQDRLMTIARSGVEQASARGESMLDEAAQVQQLLAKQISAEVSRHESQARQVQENNPEQARALLLQARAMVEKAGLDENSAAILLRRVDRDLAELDQFVAANQPKIDLMRRNRQVEEQIVHEQEQTVVVQEKLAMMVEEFNQLMDEQRFLEAEVLAKRAAELAPNEPVVQQLGRQANLMRRMTNNGQLSDAKANGFADVMESVMASSISVDDRIPMTFPDLKEWQRLTDRRASQLQGRARSEKEIEIEQRLKTPVSLHFREAPLAEVVNQLGQLAGINMYLDPRGLGDEVVATDTPVTIDLSQEISVRSALDLVLEPLHLGYVIKSEVLKITSEKLVHGEVYPVTYYVSDLVMPIPNFAPNSGLGMAGALRDAYGNVGVKMASNAAGAALGPQTVMATPDGTPNSAVLDPRILGQFGIPIGTGGGGPPQTGQPQNFGFASPAMGGGVEPDFDSLIDLITNTIEPTTWQDVGGAGAIERFETNLSLVISQTQEVHEKIADLLDQLRRLQDLQVTIEVRFIRLNDNFFEQIGIDFDFDVDDNADSPFQVFGEQSPAGFTDVDGDGTKFENAQTPSGVPGFERPQNGDPQRNIQDRDHGFSTTVGMVAPGVFSADLDVPFQQGSFFAASALPATVLPPGVAVSPNGVIPGGAALGFAILSDLEAYFFLNAVQGDVRSNVLQAPKVTLFNGQQAFVSDTVQVPFVISVIPVVGDFAAAQQPVIVVLSEGTFLSVQAVVSSDRRFIRLTVVPFFSEIGPVDTFTFTGETTTTRRSQSDGPDDATTGRENEETQTTTGTTVQLPSFQFTTVTTTVSVPDGGTVLLGGIKRMEEQRREMGVPLLNKLPYVNRLFNNVSTGKETSSLMMMVTPRIIIQEEEEALLGIAPAP